MKSRDKTYLPSAKGTINFIVKYNKVLTIKTGKHPFRINVHSYFVPHEYQLTKHVFRYKMKLAQKLKYLDILRYTLTVKCAYIEPSIINL